MDVEKELEKNTEAALHPSLEYVAWDEKSKQASAAFGQIISDLIQAVETYPQSRERSLAITNLEQSFMWMGKMIRNKQRGPAASQGGN